MTIESWLPVPGFEGYEVSSWGRVRSLPRTIVRSNGRTNSVKARIKKLTDDGKGYLVVNLSRMGRSNVRFVHQLVLEAFVGPCPERMECRHLNGVPTDNRLANLAWGTSSENKFDLVAHGNHVQARKTQCVRGHDLVPGNLLPRTNGKRDCRLCVRERKSA